MQAVKAAIAGQLRAVEVEKILDLDYILEKRPATRLLTRQGCWTQAAGLNIYGTVVSANVKA